MKSDYPLFIPPLRLGTKTPREWSSDEADEYFDWLMEAKRERVEGLLERFQKASEERDPRTTLGQLGRKVVAKLVGKPFSRNASGGSKELTSSGYALAADMGLLTAEYLVEEGAGVIRWVIKKKPKSDLSYNLPVLSGFGNLILDPVGGSIAEAQGVLSGLRSGDVWLEIFDFWLGKSRAERKGT